MNKADGRECSQRRRYVCESLFALCQTAHGAILLEIRH